MRKVFWQMMVTLDGLHEGPNHEIDWHVVDDDFMKYANDMLDSIDTILLGRRTYELFADYWPTSNDQEAPAMNELPKVVFSRTLEKVEWNNSRLVKDNVGEEVARLKEQPGKDMALIGSADLARTFLRLGLIDEYRHFANPVLLGAGTPVFQDAEQKSLKLLATQTLSSGVVVLTYQP